MDVPGPGPMSPSSRNWGFFSLVDNACQSNTSRDDSHGLAVIETMFVLSGLAFFIDLGEEMVLHLGFWPPQGVMYSVHGSERHGESVAEHVPCEWSAQASASRRSPGAQPGAWRGLGAVMTDISRSQSIVGFKGRFPCFWSICQYVNMMIWSHSMWLRWMFVENSEMIFIIYDWQPAPLVEFWQGVTSRIGEQRMKNEH